jgi:hypothetical protein
MDAFVLQSIGFTAKMNSRQSINSEFLERPVLPSLVNLKSGIDFINQISQILSPLFGFALLVKNNLLLSCAGQRKKDYSFWNNPLCFDFTELISIKTLNHKSGSHQIHRHLEKI